MARHWMLPPNEPLLGVHWACSIVLENRQHSVNRFRCMAVISYPLSRLCQERKKKPPSSFESGGFSPSRPQRAQDPDRSVFGPTIMICGLKINISIKLQQSYNTRQHLVIGQGFNRRRYSIMSLRNTSNPTGSRAMEAGIRTSSPPLCILTIRAMQG